MKRLALAIVAVAARLVPLPQRKGWASEWEAEISSWWDDPEGRRGPAAGLLLVYRSLLAFRDAAAVRKDLRRVVLDGPSPPRIDRRGRSRLIDDLHRDLRSGLRSLRRQPGFTLLATVTIAVGIGANTTIFSLVHGVLLRPLEFHEPDRVVAVWPERWFSKELFHRLQTQAESFEAVAVWGEAGLTVEGEEEARILYGPRVSAEFFDVLGVGATRGRPLTEGEDRRGRHRVILVSETYWQRDLGAHSDFEGTQLRTASGSFDVIGIVPPGVQHFGVGPADIVFPLVMDQDESDYWAHNLKVIGRLKPGVTLEQANAEIATLAGRWSEEDGRGEAWPLSANVMPLREALVGDVRSTFLMLLGAVAMMLLIATANVANLVLARSLAREREVAMRMAIGAPVGRIVRQILTESTVLALLGGIMGFTLSIAGLQAMVTLMPADTPRLMDVHVSATMFAFSLMLALLTGWIVGLLPALHLVRGDARSGIGAIGRANTASPDKRRVRSGLVVAEIALAVVLLSGAGLLAKSLRRTFQVDSGFEAENLIALTVSPGRRDFSSSVELNAYFDRMMDGIASIPGVERVAQIHAVPILAHGWDAGFARADQLPKEGDEVANSYWRAISPDYFATAGISVLRGRAFADRDDAGTEPVVIMNQTAARTLFGDEDPVGRQIIHGLQRRITMTIVGVVADVHIGGLRRQVPSVIYRPYHQGVDILLALDHLVRSMVVRTGSDPVAFERTIRRAVSNADRNAPVQQFFTMQDVIANSLATPRAAVVILAAFAGTAVLLGAIGIFGVMSYAVRERLRELAIRVALGASSVRVRKQVLHDGLKLVLAGLVLGFALTRVLGRFVEGMLFEVNAGDMTVFASVAAMLSVVAVAATYVPAFRASRADPMSVLREE